MPTQRAVFTRRKNEDGVYDSICRVCYATAASGASEEDLQAAECRHVCNIEVLYRRGLMQPPSGAG
jgi:hypothetical protein